MPQQTVRPECQVGEHSWCKPGEVRVGRDVLFTNRCACACHKGAAR
ncbi:hypothetical protein PUR59_01495 [Streptomyces sp. SP18ES09]|nr:hypothetical protein [Streptomyces sp. SP18ES09]MEE1813715.1 hypothetical protein [Streptomyces sp. SP18ES09]